MRTEVVHRLHLPASVLVLYSLAVGGDTAVVGIVECLPHLADDDASMACANTYDCKFAGIIRHGYLYPSCILDCCAVAGICLQSGQRCFCQTVGNACQSHFIQLTHYVEVRAQVFLAVCVDHTGGVLGIGIECGGECVSGSGISRNAQFGERQTVHHLQLAAIGDYDAVSGEGNHSVLQGGVGGTLHHHIVPVDAETQFLLGDVGFCTLESDDQRGACIAHGGVGYLAKGVLDDEALGSGQWFGCECDILCGCLYTEQLAHNAVVERHIVGGAMVSPHASSHPVAF